MPLFPSLSAQGRPPKLSAPSPAKLDSPLERLLANADFRRRIETFRKHGHAVELEDVPKVLDQLLNLNCVELGQVVDKLGLSYRQLQKELKVKSRLATPEQVLAILYGSVTSNRPPPPTNIKDVSALLRQSSKALAHTEDPAQRKLAQKRHAKLTRVRSELATVARPKPWDKVGLFGNLNASARIFDYVGTDSHKQSQGSLLPSSKLEWAPDSASTFVGNYLTPNLGTLVGGLITPKDRGTGGRRFEPFCTFPSVNTMHGSVAHMFSSKPQKWGYSIRGPANIPLTGFSSSPMVGKMLSLSLPLKFGLAVGERYLGAGYTFQKGRWADTLNQLRVPGTDAMLLFGITVGIQSDYINYVTGPVLNWFIDLAHAVRRARESDTWKRLVGTSPPAAELHSNPNALGDMPALAAPNVGSGRGKPSPR